MGLPWQRWANSTFSLNCSLFLYGKHKLDILSYICCPDKPLELTELPLKTWTEDDVDIQVTHCGICGSDVTNAHVLYGYRKLIHLQPKMHTLSSDWGPTPYPCVVGHEIVGVVTRVGANVKDIKVGDRAGVGAQVGSCLECD
ncbi:chaperonin 10-like protein, partial [Jimgerdemannia flammicorona]